MGKKTLKKRIDGLVDALGGAEKPTLAQIRSDLVSIGTFAQELEDGQALSEKETTIAALKQENENLNVELQTANVELKTFRAERQQQEEQERRKDLPPEQLNILRRLSSKHGGSGMTIPELWREAGYRLDETEIHVDKLEKAGLIEWHDVDGEQLWRRTMLGNELVVAKRLAGEEEEGEQEEEHPDLTQMETFVLMALAHGNRAPEYIEEYIATELPTVGPPITSPEMMLLLLIKLREKKLVSADKPSDDGPSEWKLLRAGTRLLTSRGLI